MRTDCLFGTFDYHWRLRKGDDSKTINSDKRETKTRERERDD